MNNKNSRATMLRCFETKSGYSLFSIAFHVLFLLFRAKLLDVALWLQTFAGQYFSLKLWQGMRGINSSNRCKKIKTFLWRFLD